MLKNIARLQKGDLDSSLYIVVIIVIVVLSVFCNNYILYRVFNFLISVFYKFILTSVCCIYCVMHFHIFADFRQG